MSRDYSKFLREDRTLNKQLIPRPVYTELVNAYRRQEHVFRPIYEAQFWLWDLENLERQARESGTDISSADLAQQVMNTMDDKEWWQIMVAFEKHLIDHFHEDPERWADLLDPVYDEQEASGWTSRQ